MALFNLIGGPAHGTTQDWALSRGPFIYSHRTDAYHTLGNPEPTWDYEQIEYRPMRVVRGDRYLVVVDSRNLMDELRKLTDERNSANLEAVGTGGVERRRLIRIAREATEWFDTIVATGRRPDEEDTIELVTLGRPGIGRTYAVRSSGHSHIPDTPADASWSIPVVPTDGIPENTIVMAMDGSALAAYEVTADGNLHHRHDLDLRGRVVRSS